MFNLVNKIADMGGGSTTDRNVYNTSMYNRNVELKIKTAADVYFPMTTLSVAVARARDNKDYTNVLIKSRDLGDIANSHLGEKSVGQITLFKVLECILR